LSLFLSVLKAFIDQVIDSHNELIWFIVATSFGTDVVSRRERLSTSSCCPCRKGQVSFRFRRLLWI
jgi:hypothetical protein